MRKHSTTPVEKGFPAYVEHEYERKGTLVYITASDVFTGTIVGEVCEKTGVSQFMRVVQKVMNREPYASADRVFWIVDNGSSHHPSTFSERLRKAFQNAIACQSWHHFLFMQVGLIRLRYIPPSCRGKSSRQIILKTLMDLEKRYDLKAQPFKWNFTY
jgi:hypothetical protein